MEEARAKPACNPARTGDRSTGPPLNPNHAQEEPASAWDVEHPRNLNVILSVESLGLQFLWTLKPDSEPLYLCLQQRSPVVALWLQKKMQMCQILRLLSGPTLPFPQPQPESARIASQDESTRPAEA